MKGILSRIKDIGYTVKITENAKDFIAEKGYDKNFGARPLKRAIQKYFEDPLAEEIIASNVSEGDSIKVDLKKDNTGLAIKVSKSKKKMSAVKKKEKTS